MGLRVAVVGGGLGGVTAAWQLSQLGVAVKLYEASGRLGGVLETERFAGKEGSQGFVIECGADSWMAEKPWARDLAIELGLAQDLIVSNDAVRRTYIKTGGQLLPLPDGMRMMVPTQLAVLDDSPLFSPTVRAAYAAEPGRAAELKAEALGPDQDESVANFVRRHFGEEITQTVARPLLAGVLGGNIDHLSAQAVMAPFVRLEQQYGSLILGLEAQSATASTPAPTEKSMFASLRGGLAQLIEAMAHALPAESIALDAPVERIEREPEGWRVVSAAGVARFDALLLAAPASVVRELLRPIDAEIASLLAMEASSAIIVALAYDAEAARSIRIPSGFGYLVAPEDAGPDALLAATFVHSKFPQRAPEGGALLRAFFGGDTALRLMESADEELVALAREQLGLVLGAMPKPVHSLVRRWPHSLPQYAVGHRLRMRELEKSIGRMGNLRLVGNSYAGVGMPDVIREARQAGQSLVAEMAAHGARS